MNNNFRERFDLALDYQRYLASKGIYVEDGNRCYWQPTDWTDLDPEETYSVGAAKRGEFDNDQDWSEDRGEF